MKISIFGLGYVGCVSLGCLSHLGHKVIGVDISDSKIQLINKGKPTIIEKDIDKYIQRGYDDALISATVDYKQPVLESDVSFICVGTPSTENGHLNLDYVFNTARQISEALMEKKGFHTVVIRSTVFPGTNLKYAEIIEKMTGKTRNKDFAIVSNPEFLREGSAVEDYFNPALTVIGSESSKAIEIMKKIYKPITAPIVETSVGVAEIIKYVNNSFHALKISFANEVGNICKSLNIDSHEVMRVFGMDDRLNISTYYFKPGFAYGGSCLPKDLKGLQTIAHDAYLKTHVLDAIVLTNEYQKERAYDMIVKTGKRKIGIFGLSFKKGTDDLRYSPTVDLAEKLIGKGFEVYIYDKNVKLSNISGTNKEFIDKHIPHLSNLISDDALAVYKSSDVVVFHYKENLFSELINGNKEKIIIDLARITDNLEINNYNGISW